MKRMIPLVLAACLLTGCGGKESAPPTVSAPSQPAISVEIADPAPQPAEPVIYTVTMAAKESTVCTETGETLIATSFRYPVLTAHGVHGDPITEGNTEREAAALSVVEAFNDSFADWNSGEDFQGDMEIAMEDYAWRKAEGMDWMGNYTMELSCTAYQTRRMVSVSGLYYSYTGGAHGNSAHLAWNFDLENGTFFGPELLGGAELQTAVAEELKRQSAERAAEYDALPEELYWADYEAVLEDWQSSAVSFNEKGMTVAYSPYELAAYAFGAQVYEIPYEFLEPYLSLQGMELLGLVSPPGA